VIDRTQALPALGTATLSDYMSLTKPRVVTLILLTTMVGFLLAAGGSGVDVLLLARTLLGTGLVAAGTLTLNQYMERRIDALMKRTYRRPLPDRRMQPVEALAFGVVLTSAGLLVLALTVNPVSALVTATTVITYLFCYTPLKTRTALCTIVGAFPGALPPVTGWTAAGGELGIGAAALFFILFFWQLPHSLAIAHLYRDDYQRAGVKLLPTVDRDGGSTGRQTVLNCMTLLVAGLFPTLVGMSGWTAFWVALAMGGLMLWQGVGLAIQGTHRRARKLLYASYLYIPVVLLAIALDRTGL